MACNPSDIPTTDVKPSFMDRFIRWTCFCKISTPEFLGNIIKALYAISDAINNYTDAVTQRGYAVAEQHFRISGGANVTNGQLIDNILVRSAFNQKIVGFGASILTFPTSGGPDPNDDVIEVRLYDYTAGQYASDTITLTNAQKQGSHTDDGNAIAANITPGHEYGVKIVYSNTDGGAFVIPDVDVFIYTEPQELTYT